MFKKSLILSLVLTTSLIVFTACSNKVNVTDERRQVEPDTLEQNEELDLSEEGVDYVVDDDTVDTPEAVESETSTVTEDTLNETPNSKVSETPASKSTTSTSNTTPQLESKPLPVIENTPQVKVFSKEELAQYDGKNGQKAYVAVDGNVYDVTNADGWKNGVHKGGVTAGKDQSAAINQSPHGKQVLAGLNIVGKLNQIKSIVGLQIGTIDKKPLRSHS